MTEEEQIERDTEIKAEYALHRLSMREMVAKYDISRGRIHQIISQPLKVKKPLRKAFSHSEYERYRYNTDPTYKLRKLLRNRFKMALRKDAKKSSILALIGCSITELKEYLASQFQEGMTWKNHGKWHIDHIIPLASAKSYQELERLCHHTNLQPLWATDNQHKGKKVIHTRHPSGA